MKTIILFLLATMTMAFAGPGGARFVANNPLNSLSAEIPAQAPPPQIRDPYRVINGTNFIVGPGWVKFYGKVTQVTKDGVMMQGFYTGSGLGEDYEGVDFYVADFPYQVAENEVLAADGGFYAVTDGVFTYTTVIGASRTVRKLEYGDIYVPPPLTPEQIAAAKQAAAAQKRISDQKANDAQARALKSNMDAAAAGDVYGLLRMGERYRDGDGVTQDVEKARQDLHLAAIKGSDTASNEFAQLPPEK